jgi:oxygen-independent coproporphyrinogen-3 oxidase
VSELALYIHWPFCKSKCPYCDFNSHVREGVNEARWKNALLAELDHWAGETEGARVSTVFFGGGTPSLMNPSTAAALIERISSRWGFAPEAEITLEANPTSVEAARFRELREAGVNRVSLGVQALNDRDLKFLGRGHDTQEARKAVDLARDIFPRFSFDLIYARPGQETQSWRAELSEALALAGDHLSLYQLTIEPGTAFAPAHARGDFILPDDEEAGSLYEVTQEVLGTAGLPAYEISNHARPGQECRHNLAYWRSQDYAGIGPGAHGRLNAGPGRYAARQYRAPETWLEAVEKKGHGTESLERLSATMRRDELLMMGLRLAEGVSQNRFLGITGRSFEDDFGRDRLAPLIEGGFLELDAQALRATEAGRQRLNAVLGSLLA